MEAATPRLVILPLPGNQMTKNTRLVFVIAAIFVGLALTYSLLERPKRTTQAFAGHLYHERYAEAALMLQAPSALEVTPDGELILTDNAGESTTVPAARLPFIIGGHAGTLDHDFMMTALQGSKNGVLDTPAVRLYLCLDGGEVRIERVDS
jgi:hypothetical protein